MEKLMVENNRLYGVISGLEQQIKELKTGNQSLHDQITEMENERLRIDSLAKNIHILADGIVKIGV